MTHVPGAVFVIDDDPSVRRSLDRLLRSHGFVVHTFATGTEFLEGGYGRRPGCIVLDVMMRGQSGFDIMERLACDGERHRIILMSGHGDSTTAERARKAGCVSFLRKPFDADLLLDAISEALAQPG
jgi:FixJ family two-component response regulator